jgi:BirA family biotin operon repressor/biotin-[acetyl-CoA-carboxylase] ligase
LTALDARVIAAALAPATRVRLRDVDVVAEIDSTNAELMRRAVLDPTPVVLLAETQTAGRGRRGKTWLSPPGDNLYLSLAWPVRAPAGLSLAVGVACAQALHAAGVQVKWPNDLVADGRKLGGVLIELAGGIAVIGVGLNVRMPADAGDAIDQPWTDLARLGIDGDRNAIAARLIDALVAAMLAFEARGFEAFASRWQALDALAGREVRVASGNEIFHGIAAGVAADGGLRVTLERGERVFHSADVSVRAA